MRRRPGGARQIQRKWRTLRRNPPDAGAAERSHGPTAFGYIPSDSDPRIGTGGKMIGAGTFLNPLLKVVSTVAILAAIYFFMVRPILDTTEDISGGVLNSVNKGLDQAAKEQKQANQAEKQAQHQGAQSFEIQANDVTPKQADKLLKCVQSANGDVTKIQACQAIVAQ